MIDKKSMEQGWAFASKVTGVNVALGANSSYAGRVSAVESEVQKLAENLAALKTGASDASVGGFAAEEWHAGTFNIEAAKTGSGSRAEVLVGDRNQKWSADIRVTDGNGTATDYGSKYYKTAADTADKQSLLNVETREPGYKGQKRLVPSDQLNDVIKESNISALKEHYKGRHDVAEAYADTADNAVDTVTDGEIKSKPLSKDDSTELAREIKKEEVDLKKHGVQNDLMSPKEIMLKATQAGLTAAAISAIIQTAPDIFKAIDYLIKNKEIDPEQLKNIGVKGLTAGAEGFIIGSTACVMQLKIAEGMLGPAIQKAVAGPLGPTVLGTIVSLAYTTIKNSIMVAAGKMTPKQMGSALIDTVVVSGGYVAGAAIGGAIGQAIGFAAPVIGYVIGSLVGCAFAAVYNIGKKKFISFCVDSGFTCFGLVDQDYSLPEEVLRDMGIDITPISRTQISRTEINRIQSTAATSRTSLQTVDIKIVKRGIIGVNQVGYVLA